MGLHYQVASRVVLDGLESDTKNLKYQSIDPRATAKSRSQNVITNPRVIAISNPSKHKHFKVPATGYYLEGQEDLGSRSRMGVN